MNILPWHQNAWQKLQKMVEQNHLPHALLITGCAQIGKFELMQQLVGLLIDDEDKIKKDNAREEVDYPVFIRRSNYENMIYCRAEISEKSKKRSKEIRVDQVRDFCDALNKTANKLQIGVLFYAEQMTDSAANALLKTLEEPRENTLIILLSHNSKRLPMTIISRCQSVHIAPAYDDKSIRWISSHIREEQNADFDLEQLLETTHGVPFKVVEELGNDDFIDYQKWQNQLLDLAIYPTKINQLDDFSQQHSTILHCLQNLVIEAIRSKSLATEGGLVELNKIVAEVRLDFLFKLLDDITHAIYLLKTSVNSDLLLDNILIVWSHITHLRDYPAVISHKI